MQDKMRPRTPHPARRKGNEMSKRRCCEKCGEKSNLYPVGGQMLCGLCVDDLTTDNKLRTDLLALAEKWEKEYMSAAHDMIDFKMKWVIGNCSRELRALIEKEDK